MTNEDKERLQHFREHADYVFDHSLVKSNNIKVNTKRSWNAENSFTETRHEIDVERLESLILRLRMFYIQEDAIHFESVANICSANLPDGVEVRVVRDLKKLFRSKLAGSDAIRISHKGKSYGSVEILELAFYGDSFHKNPLKRQIFLELRKGVTDSFVQDAFINSIINMLNAVSYLRALVNMILEQDASHSSGSSAASV